MSNIHGLRSSLKIRISQWLQMLFSLEINANELIKIYLKFLKLTNKTNPRRDTHKQKERKVMCIALNSVKNAFNNQVP